MSQFPPDRLMYLCEKPGVHLDPKTRHEDYVSRLTESEYFEAMRVGVPVRCAECLAKEAASATS